MLHEATKTHILSLSDADLLRYVLTGRRVYDPEPLAFAQAELGRRAIPQEQLAILRPPILADLAAMDAAPEPDPTRPQAPAIVCQLCGVEAPTAYLQYYQNIGVIKGRIYTYYSVSLCKRCSNRIFLKYSAVTFFFGWWSPISMFVAPFFLLNNLMQFATTIRLKAVPKTARPPQMDDDVLERIGPFVEDLSSQLLAGNEAGDIARDIAAKSGLTPGQVWWYLRTTAKNQLPPPTLPIRRSRLI